MHELVFETTLQVNLNVVYEEHLEVFELALQKPFEFVRALSVFRFSENLQIFHCFLANFQAFRFAMASSEKETGFLTYPSTTIVAMPTIAQVPNSGRVLLGHS